VGPCQREGRRDPLSRGEMVPTRAPNLYLYYTILGGLGCTLFKDINYLAYILAFLHNILLNGTRQRYINIIYIIYII